MLNGSSDEFVNELLPEELDWASWVRENPWPALALSALGGFLIGRLHGDQIVEGASEMLNDKVQETVERVKARSLR